MGNYITKNDENGARNQSLVTAVMCVFNGEKTFERALTSILNQTYKNIEILINDNASTDGTTAICEKYLKQDDRIKYFRYPKTVNVAVSAENAILKSNGKYLILASDDDWWDPTYVEKLISKMEKNPKIGIMQSIMRFIDTDGNTINDLGFSDCNPSKFLPAFKRLWLLFIAEKGYNNFINGIMRGNLIKKLTDTFSIHKDESTIAPIIAEYDYGYCDEVLMFKSVHNIPFGERRRHDDGTKENYYDQEEQIGIDGLRLNTIKYLFSSKLVSIKTKIIVLPFFLLYFHLKVLKNYTVKKLKKNKLGFRIIQYYKKLKNL